MFQITPLHYPPPSYSSFWATMVSRGLVASEHELDTDYLRQDLQLSIGLLLEIANVKSTKNWNLQLAYLTRMVDSLAGHTSF